MSQALNCTLKKKYRANQTYFYPRGFSTEWTGGERTVPKAEPSGTWMSPGVSPKWISSVGLGVSWLLISQEGDCGPCGNNYRALFGSDAAFSSLFFPWPCGPLQVSLSFANLFGLTILGLGLLWLWTERHHKIMHL